MIFFIIIFLFLLINTLKNRRSLNFQGIHRRKQNIQRNNFSLKYQVTVCNSREWKIKIWPINLPYYYSGFSRIIMLQKPPLRWQISKAFANKKQERDRRETHSKYIYSYVYTYILIFLIKNREGFKNYFCSVKNYSQPKKGCQISQDIWQLTKIHVEQLQAVYQNTHLPGDPHVQFGMFLMRPKSSNVLRHQTHTEIKNRFKLTCNYIAWKWLRSASNDAVILRHQPR